MDDRFERLLEQVLEREPNSVNSSDRFRSYEEWDSLALLSVLAMINMSYNVIIPQVEFDALETVEDISTLISNRVAQGHE